MALPLDWVPDPVQQRNNELIGLELRLPVPQARVYNSANISIPNNANTALTFNSERYDNGGLHSTAANTSRLTAPIAGLYEFGASVEFEANVTGHRGLFLRVNGATIIAFDNRMAITTAAEPTRMTIESEYRLAASDYVEIVVQQNSGGALNVVAAGNYSPEFWMVRLAGYTAQTVEA